MTSGPDHSRRKTELDLLRAENRRMGDELAELSARLEEAEEVLRAIRAGEVDALVVSGPHGDQVYTLKGADQPYRTLIEEMSEGAATLSAGGTVLYSNRRFAELVGRQPEAVPGTEITELVAEADRGPLVERLAAVADDSRGGALQVLSAGDAATPLLLSLQALPAGSAAPVGLVATDLTEHIALDEAIRQSHEELERLVAERTADLASANEALRASRTAALNMMADAVAARTAAEDSKAALQQAEERLRIALDSAQLGTFDFDLAAQTSMWDEQMARMCGVPSLRRPDPAKTLEVVHPDDRAMAREAFAAAEDPGGDGHYESEHRIVWPDGSTRWHRASGTAYFAGTGRRKRAVRLVGVNRDITEQKRAEEALRKSREDLNRAQAVAHTGSWRLEVQTDELVWSDENHRIFGVPIGTPMSYETFLDCVHPDDRESVDRAWTAALEGTPYDIEHRVVGGDVVKWVRERAELEFDDNGEVRGGFGTTQDITKRKQQEEELRGTLEWLSMTQRAARAGFWDWDIPSGVLNWSEEFYELLGLSPAAEASFETWRGALHPEDLATAEANINDALENRVPLENEYRIVRPDGAVTWVRAVGATVYDEAGRPLRMSGICIDVTTRRAAESALRESEAKYRGLFEAFHETVAVYQVIRDKQGTIVDRVLRECNQAFVESAAAVSVEELAGRTAGQIFSKEYADANLPHIRKAMESGTVHVFESRRTSRGEERHFITTVVPLDEERYLFTGRDITDIKETEEALRQSRRRAELLAQTAGTLLSGEDPQALVEELCVQVMEELDCHAFFNFMADDDAGRLHLNAYAGIPANEARRIEWLDYGVAVCGCAAQRGCRIVAEDIQSTPDPLTELVASYGIRAYACHPLTTGETVTGTLSFGTRSRDRFQENDLTLMKAVADHVAIAMARARAEQSVRESEQRHRELAGELELERAKLAAAIDRADVGLVFTESDGTFLSMNAKALELHGFDSEKDMFAQFARYVEEFELLHPDGRPMATEEWPMSRALRGDYVRDFEARVRRRGTGHEWIGSYGAAPVYGAAGEIVLIVFSIFDLTIRRRLQEELRRELETSNVLLESASMLAEWTDSLETLDGIVLLVAAVTGHARVGLHVWHAGDRELELVAATGDGMPPVGTRTSPEVLSPRNREALVTKRTTVTDFDELTPSRRGMAKEYGGRLSLSVPIVHRDLLVGLLAVDEPGERRPFSERQIELAEGIAAQAAVAIENAGLYDAQRRIATVLQEQFIHPLPQIDGLEVAVVAETAHQPELIGGDFHDVFELPHGLVAVLLGDVEGKGVSAAALSETVRSAVRALAIVSPSPRYILNNVNRMLLQQHSTQFVTALLTIVDPVDGLALSASAGHPAGILIRGGTVSTVAMRFGVPLGALPWDHEQTSFRMQPGDSLVVYTDGVSEARRDGDIFGEEGVVEVVKATAHEPPARIAAAVRDAAVGFARYPQDDMQLVVLRFTGRVSSAGARRAPSRLGLVVPDAPWRLIDIRGSVRDFLHAHAVEDAVVDDLVMSVEEACTNALRHSGSTEPTEVRLSVDPSVVDISVRDHGCGFDADRLDLTQVPDPLALGGRGLYMIRSVVDELELINSEGTTVHLRKYRDSAPIA
jgi:PAS domain S-box-containing protein